MKRRQRKTYLDMLDLQLRCTPSKKSKKIKNDGRQLSKSACRNCQSLDSCKQNKNTFDDFPCELLKLIMDRLQNSVGDLIRISAVCKSWQIIADSIRHEQQQKQRAGPLLLLRPVKMNRDHTIYHLFDFYQNRTKKIIVPVFITTRYLSVLKSSNEWILTYTGAHDNIRFLNLVSKEEIEIPRINQIAKVIISATTPLDPNCVIMTIFGEEKKLALYNKRGGGNNNWNTLINSELFGQAYEDIVYFKGEFYAIDAHGNLVVVRGINKKEPKVSKVATSVETTKSDLLYLVESCGDLFLIVRTFRLKNGDSRRKCEAYKLNLCGGIWQKVNSLGDGSSTFFIGGSVSVSVSAKDFPVKGNCIYYIGFLFDAKTDERDVFNLSTNRFESKLLFS